MEFNLYSLLMICAAVLAAVVLIPFLQCRRLRGTPKELFDAKNESRRTIAQIVGGLAVILGFFLTQFQVKTTEKNLGLQIAAQKELTTQTLNFQKEQSAEQHKLEYAESERKERERIYSELSGLRIVRSQLIVSRFSADVNFQYLQYVWNHQGNGAGSPYEEEARANLQQMQTLAIDISKANQRIFELVQLIPLHFHKTPQLERAVQVVFDYKSADVKGAPPNLGNDDMLKWKTSALKSAQDLDQHDYAQPVNRLLKLLKADLDSEKP